MTVREFIYQIQKSVKDPSGAELSMDLMLTYLTEESRYCCGMFPQNVSITEDLTDNEVTNVLMYLMKPRSVWIEGHLADKVTGSQMHQLIDGALNASFRYSWAVINGVVNIEPGIGTARILGELYTPEYDHSDLDKTLVGKISTETNEVSGIVGIPAPVLRYRVLKRAAEESMQWDQANYFMQNARIAELEARRVYESDTNETTGFVSGGEYL